MIIKDFINSAISLKKILLQKQKLELGLDGVGKFKSFGGFGGDREEGALGCLI